MSTKFEKFEQGEAAFSPARTYRYWLRREWDADLPTVGFIALNPSTADERQLDPTLRRCVGFASGWGYGSFVIANLFAFRATNPMDMRQVAEPVGDENDAWLRHVVQSCRITVCAWGVHGNYRSRDRAVLEMLRPWWGKLHHLGVTRMGHPKHPLYLPSYTMPLPYRPILERAA